VVVTGVLVPAKTTLPAVLAAKPVPVIVKGVPAEPLVGSNRRLGPPNNARISAAARARS
jgi:hypothetical protein